MDLAVQKKPCLVVVLNDFNAKSKYFYEYDKTNLKGNLIETFFLSLDFIKLLTIQIIYQIVILHVLVSFLNPKLIWS